MLSECFSKIFQVVKVRGHNTKLSPAHGGVCVRRQTLHRLMWFLFETDLFSLIYNEWK